MSIPAVKGVEIGLGFEAAPPARLRRCTTIAAEAAASRDRPGRRSAGRPTTPAGSKAA